MNAKDEIEILTRIKHIEVELSELKTSLSRPREPKRWTGYIAGYHRNHNNSKHSYFRTMEMAMLREKQREAEDELFNIWEYLVGDWRPDWNDEEAEKIYLDYHEGNIDTDRTYTICCLAPYRYFPNSELALKQYELASDHARAYMRGEF